MSEIMISERGIRYKRGNLLDKSVNVYVGWELDSHDKSIKQVAIKNISKTRERENKFIKYEFSVIKLLKSQHIVELFDEVIQGDNYFIITEFCQRNLQDEIRQIFRLKEFKEFCENRKLAIVNPQDKVSAQILWKKDKIEEIQQNAIHFISQILAGYISLLKNQVIHRDLNPENIRIYPDNKLIKINGFSASRTLQEFKASQQMTQTGDTNYQSPQQSTNYYTSKCDMYAIGVMFFELVTGLSITSVYLDPHRKGININQKNYPFIGFNSRHINKDIKNFIIKCLKYEERQRMEWEQVYKHPVFEGTILTNDEVITKEISMIGFYMNPYNYSARTIKSILNAESKKEKLRQKRKKEKKNNKAHQKLKIKNQNEKTQKQPKLLKIDILINSIRCAKRKHPELIQWPLFYREMLKIHKIPENIISKAFCLIDKESKGTITKQQLQYWVSCKDLYTYEDITENQVLRCMDIIKEHQEEVCQDNMSMEKFICNFKKIKIDQNEIVDDEAIKLTYNHLKCNLKSNKFEKWKQILSEGQAQIQYHYI